MRIAVAREVRAGERRIALVPSLLARLLQEGQAV
jgi:alanine dehydrogenase